VKASEGSCIKLDVAYDESTCEVAHEVAPIVNASLLAGQVCALDVWRYVAYSTDNCREKG
jgi:hypothetical protein